MNRLYESDEALIEGLARVVAVEDAVVWLAAEQPAGCSTCTTRSACGSGSAKPSASWRAPRSLGQGQPQLALGDMVRIGVDRDALTRAALTAYALPLATMLLAVLLMQDAGNASAIAAALAGLLVGVAAARVLTRRWRKSLAPVVLGRVVAAARSSCAPGTAPGALIPVAIPVVQQRSP